MAVTKVAPKQATMAMASGVISGDSAVGTCRLRSTAQSGGSRAEGRRIGAY